MPWDSVDKYRDEDTTEPRKTSRRRFKVGGRRRTDNKVDSYGSIDRATRILGRASSDDEDASARTHDEAVLGMDGHVQLWMDFRPDLANEEEGS